MVVVNPIVNKFSHHFCTILQQKYMLKESKNLHLILLNKKKITK